MHKIDECIKIKDAADFLGVSPNTLRNWEKRGELKTYRNPKNKYRLYMKIDLEKLRIDGYIKIKDAADFLSVSPGTLRNWGKKGKLKTYRNPKNKYRLYMKIDLEKLLKEIAMPNKG